MFVAAAITPLYFFPSGSEIRHPPGPLVAEEPLQRDTFISTIREKNGHCIATLASFDIRARVISTARYRFDRGADLSPVDLVLGWGEMSDSKVLERLNFSQSGRAYSWWAQTLPVPRQVSETHSANMHRIPADDTVARQLKHVRVGNLVRLKDGSWR